MIPKVLSHGSTDEYSPLPWRRSELELLARVDESISANAGRIAVPAVQLAHDRRGEATALRAVDAAAGGGFYAIPEQAELEAEAADATFVGDEVVVDVQTHLVNPSRFRGPAAEGLVQFLQAFAGDRWGDGVDPGKLSGAAWALDVFGGSDTAVALVTALPGLDTSVLTGPEIATVRDVAERYAGTGRILTHTIVHPNAAGEIERLPEFDETLRPSAWKVYTMWEPGEPGPGHVVRGWLFDDEDVGVPFLEQVRRSSTRIVCAHKGIAGLVGSSPEGASPRDIGPASRANPDITFVVYHSGYELDPFGEESTEADRGVGRLVTSLADAGVDPGANVYAELGSTWYLMMRRPVEAAHVLGKLLRAVGEDRILWGTDSTFYGPPQFMIDAFRAFTIPERMQTEFAYQPLTTDVKAKILSGNAAALYGIDLAVAAEARKRDPLSWLPAFREEMRRNHLA